MYEKYLLGDDKARATHDDIINHVGAYSLTLTLNPKFNGLPVNEQYNKFSREIKKLFNELEQYYNTLMISFEFTKDYNVHAHLYFYTDVEDIALFEQNFKKEKQKYQVIGRNYKLKIIDEVSEELKHYPFKDIERTIKYSKLENVLFTPFHFVKRVHIVGSLRSPKRGNISIEKFMKWCEAGYNRISDTPFYQATFCPTCKKHFNRNCLCPLFYEK